MQFMFSVLLGFPVCCRHFSQKSLRMLSRKAAMSLFCKGIPHAPAACSDSRTVFFRLPADSIPQEHIRSFKETIIGFLTDREVILKLTAERKELFHRCAALKAEVKEAE